MSKRLVPGTDDLLLDSSGMLRYGRFVFDDLRTPVTAIKLSGSKPPVWTSYKGGLVLAFEDQAVNFQIFYWVWQLPHSYKFGTTLEAHVHTVPEDNTAGNVYWEFTHSISERNAAFPGQTTVNTTQAMPEITDQHQRHDIASMIGSSITTTSAMIICSLARRSDDGQDTFNGKDVLVLEVDMHYQIDTPGSHDEDDKSPL